MSGSWANTCALVLFLIGAMFYQTKASAAAIACNANETAQTFSFSGTNTWPSGTTSKSFNVGSGSNAVTLTFTNTQAVTPMSGDPQLKTLGNTANTLSVSSNGGYTGGTLLSTFALSTNRTINKLSYTIMDEDHFNGRGYLFRDRTVSSTNVGFTTAITAQVGANQTISAATGTATATNSANCDDTDNSCNIYLEFNQTGISSASSQFIAAHTGTSTQQTIGFNTFAWCLPKKTLTLRKVWVNAKVNDAVTVTATGLTSLSAVANTTSETDTGIAQGVTSGSSYTIGETFTTGSSADYNSVLSCTGNATALAGNVLTVNAADTAIVCTQTNTRKTTTITLNKAWSAAAINDTASVILKRGVATVDTLASTANTATETDADATPFTANVGETLNLSETLGGANAGQYTATLACNNSVTVGGSGDFVVPATPTNCTVTNTRKTATITLKKAWSSAAINDTATVTLKRGATSVDSLASTANTATETDTDSTPFTANVGETLNLSETLGGSNAGQYTATLSCDNSVTVGPTGDFTVPATATNCTVTNTRKTATITLKKAWSSAAINDTATVTLKRGATSVDSLASTADTATETDTDSTPFTANVGETLNLSETLGGSNADQYTATLSCDSSVTVSGTGDFTVPATATNCTVTNTRKTATITLKKTWSAGSAASDTATVSLKRGATSVDSLSSTATAAGNTDTDSTPFTANVGETLNLSETLGSSNAGQYTATLSCDNSVTINGSGDFTVPATATNCTVTNTRNVATTTTISGRVFNDNSGTTGTASNAYNGTQQTGENGIAGVTINLTNCASTMLATTQTDAAGDYQFTVLGSSLPAGNVCIVESNPSGYSSVSGGINGSTGYNRTTDTITVALTGASSYAANNFGDAILGIILTSDGQQTIPAGQTASYTHQLTVMAPETVNGLSVSQTASPTGLNWTQVLYRDSNCNGMVDGSEGVAASPGLILPGQTVCLAVVVNSPANASTGAQLVSSLQASYSVTVQDGSVLTGNSQLRTDTTLIGSAGLQMVKQVRTVSSCPSTAADIAAFGQSNTARNGDYLEYEIIYRNRTSSTLGQVVIKDEVPAGTLFRSASCEVVPTGNSCVVELQPAANGSGPLRWKTISAIPSQGEGRVRFCVQVPALAEAPLR